MFTKDRALKIAVITLSLLAVMDLFRGYMHTFNIMYASENIAHMTQTPDTLNLMNTFGISNFLTAFIYILIVVKAKDLAPYVLVILPFSYLLGIISNNVTGVAAMQTAEWNGQYMMYIYLTVSAVMGINYFISAYKNRETTTLKEGA